MSNLDYEQRMSALNRLIHETLGVSLSTVRAAYGRARNANINVQSTSTVTGTLPVSSARPVALDEMMDDWDDDSLMYVTRLYQSTVDGLVSHFPVIDMPAVEGPSFLSRFRRAENAGVDDRHAAPMLVYSTGAENESDWHKLRNEFWSIARTDSTVMERYKRDVLK